MPKTRRLLQHKDGAGGSAPKPVRVVEPKPEAEAPAETATHPAARAHSCGPGPARAELLGAVPQAEHDHRDPGRVATMVMAPPPPPGPPLAPPAPPAPSAGPAISEGDIDDAFDRLTITGIFDATGVVAETGPIGDPDGRPARADADVAAHGTSTSQDRAAVRATFEELAAIHVAPVRNLMLEIRWGEAPTRFIGLARPALRSLRAMAAELELGDLVPALDAYDAALATVAASGASTITGAAKERLMGAYFPLMRGFAGAFGLEGGRDRREPIIIDALLDEVPGVNQDVLDRLCLVGLGRLPPLLQARPDEIAVVADIPRLVAERIAARVAELVASAPPGLPRARAAGAATRRPPERAPATLEDFLLARLKRDQVLLKLRRGEPLARIELGGADLARVQLGGATLARADLEGANLQGAVLRGADLRNASLRGADLSGADLEEANLENADLFGARLDRAGLAKANLRRANLQAASLIEARLTGARLSFALLSSAKLIRAELSDAVFIHAELHMAELGGVAATGANFASANLRAANLTDGGFSHARFDEANLEGARATAARFRRASFTGADLRRADFTGADLRQATLQGAALDAATITGAKVAGLLPSGVPASDLHADWVDASGSDGTARAPGSPAPASAAVDGEIAMLVTGVSAAGQRRKPGARYFGAGDVLRNALLDFGAGARVEIDSLFENCVVRLQPGTELVIGKSGLLAGCRILGGGAVTIHGQFYEQDSAGPRSPSLAGLHTLTVASTAVLVATVEQAPAQTRFRIQPGARLRLKIRNPMSTTNTTMTTTTTTTTTKGG